MKDKIRNWAKTHKKLSVVIPSIAAIILLLGAMLPVYADWSEAYLDVTGTYYVSSAAAPRELDNDRHPRVKFNRLIITTQVDKAITLATLEHMGTDIDLDGLVGPGTRNPTIYLYGTDSDGTHVNIQGRVRTNRDGDVLGIYGRMMAMVTSDGSRWEDSADGTSAISAVDYHSEPLSCLIVGGTDANPKTLLFHNPYASMSLSELSNLRENQLSFWFNLEVATTIGPEMMLRFAPVVRGEPTIQTYYGGGTSGLVDITIMPYQAPYAGTGAWVECDLAVDAATIIYYGNDPTDYTAFGGTPLSDIADIEAAINAEVAMVADGDNASNWVLTMVAVELWEAGDRDCYVDDVTIDGQLYTLEPNSYMATFRATLQP